MVYFILKSRKLVYYLAWILTLAFYIGVLDLMEPSRSIIDNDRCVGSITDKIVFELVANNDVKDVLDSPLTKFMSDSFPIIGEDTPLSAISGLLFYNQAVLISHNGKIKGIITKPDLLKIAHK